MSGSGIFGISSVGDLLAPFLTPSVGDRSSITNTNADGSQDWLTSLIAAARAHAEQQEGLDEQPQPTSLMDLPAIAAKGIPNSPPAQPTSILDLASVIANQKLQSQSAPPGNPWDQAARQAAAEPLHLGPAALPWNPPASASQGGGFLGDLGREAGGLGHSLHQLTSGNEAFGIPTQKLPGPLGPIADAMTSPLSIATIGAGAVTGGATGLGIAAGRALAGNTGAVLAQEGAEKGLNAIGTPPWLTTTVGVLASLAGGSAGEHGANFGAQHMGITASEAPGAAVDAGKGAFQNAKVTALGGKLTKAPEPDIDHLASNPLIAFENPKPGLTKGERMVNAVRTTITTAKDQNPIFDEKITPLAKDMRSNIQKFQSAGTPYVNAAIRTDSKFKLDNLGRAILPDGEHMDIPDLYRQVVAERQIYEQGQAQARYFGVNRPFQPKYTSMLTPDQIQAMDDEHAIARNWVQTGKALGLDMSDYDDYLTRGPATPEEGLRSKGGTPALAGGKAFSESEQKFRTMGEGRQQGYSYAPTHSEAVRLQVKDLSNRFATKRFSDQLLNLQSADGNPMFVKSGTTPFGFSRPNLKEFPEDYVGRNSDVAVVNRSLQRGSPFIGGLAKLATGISGLRTIGDLQTVLRTSAASFMNPGDAMKSFWQGVKSIGSESAGADWMAAHDAEVANTGKGIDTATAARNYGLEFVTPNDHPIIGIKGHNLGNAPGVRNLNRFLTNYLNAFRLQALEDQADRFSAAGIDMETPANQRALGNVINLATGAGPRVGGDTLSGLVNFPRWVGSQLAFLGKAVSDGTLQGAYARESLIRVLGLGVGLTYAVNSAQGKRTTWTNGHPVMHLGDVTVNPFPGWNTYVSTITKASPVSLDKDHNLQSPMAAFQYFIQSKGSPVVTIPLDLAQGQTPVGDNASVTDPTFWARQLAPFNVSDVSKQTFTNPHAAGALALSDVGLSSYLDQPTKFEQAASALDKALRAQFPNLNPNHTGEWRITDLNQQELDQFKKSPAYQQHKDLVAAAVKELGPQPTADPVQMVDNAYNLEKDRHAQALQQAEKDFEQTKDGVSFRKAVADENAQHATANEDIRALAQSTPLGRAATDPKTGKKSNDLTVADIQTSTQPEDQAVDKYYELYDDPSVQLPFGQVDWNKLDNLQQSYLNGLDDKTRAYVEQRLSDISNKGVTDSKGNTYQLPGLQMLDQAKQLVQPYYSAQDQVFSSLQKQVPALAGYSSYSDLQNQLQQSAMKQGVDPSVLTSLFDKTPAGKTLSTITSTIQRAMRGANPNLDQALQIFYGSAPVNPYAALADQYGDTSFDQLGPVLAAQKSNPTPQQQLQFAQQYGRKGVRAQIRTDLLGDVGSSSQYQFQNIFGP